MKKSLIALAVLAASGAAMAQSSVTLFGVVDAGHDVTPTATVAVGNWRCELRLQQTAVWVSVARKTSVAA
jgi:predicted porin